MFAKTITLVGLLVACSSPKLLASVPLSHKPLTLKLPSGDSLRARLAVTAQEQSKGLSGVKDSQFSANDGMFFFYQTSGPRRFWMPDTYFDLDIFFLDKNLKVLAVERGVPHHPGRKTPPEIAKTKTYYCRHALEMKHSSPLAAKIKVGTRLRALPHPIFQTKLHTRRN